MKTPLIFVFVISALLATPWLVNAYKFFNCDFESSYRCETIHGAGIAIPPLAFATVWFESDN